MANYRAEVPWRAALSYWIKLQISRFIFHGRNGLRECPLLGTKISDGSVLDVGALLPTGLIGPASAFLLQYPKSGTEASHPILAALAQRDDYQLRTFPHRRHIRPQP